MSRPLVRFVALGALAFAARGALDLWRPAWTGAADTAEASRPGPGPAGDDALFERAVALGLHETDPVVHRRLVANLRFLEPATRATDSELVREARALGMHRTDPVVRRRLVNVMRLRLEADDGAPDPSEDELRAHFAAHPDRWREPARVRIEHVFFSGSLRGAAADRDAEQALLALRAGAAGSGGSPLPGDAYPEDVTTGLRSERELARILGPAVARTAFELAGSAWSAPVRSVYGAHLVRVRERVPGNVSPFDAVRASVREDLRAERADAAPRAFSAAAPEPGKRG